MATKHDLVDWVYSALSDHGGRATMLEVAKHIWKHHADDLRTSGDLFYTWQYDFRWAATHLRKDGQMKSAQFSPPGVWELSRG